MEAVARRRHCRPAIGCRAFCSPGGDYDGRRVRAPVPRGTADGATGRRVGGGERRRRAAPIDYDDAPYESYFEGDGFGLAAHRGTGGRDWDREDVDPKTVVLGLEHDGEALGVPLPVVDRADGVVTTTVGGLDIVVFATEDGIHAFEDPGCDWRRVPGGFRAGEDTGAGPIYDGATGAPVEELAERPGEKPVEEHGEETAVHPDGVGNAERLRRVPARRLFAFAWQDDHGPDAFLLDPGG